jgi:autotransporter-associated beta strand protein
MGAPRVILPLLIAASASGITITGYSADSHDRFDSGFPVTPVDNASADFVGKDHDWSSVGWSAADGTKGFGLLSPRHYLVARHYGGAATLNFTDGDGGAVTGAAQASVVNTDTGLLFSGQTVRDLSVGRLTAPLDVDWSVPRTAVLDLNTSSVANSLSAYANLQIFLYGRGASGAFSPRVVSTSVLAAGNDANGQYLLTNLSDATFQSGDSGSPAFHGWTNPNGDKELALLGNNAGVDTTNGYNILNFTGLPAVMAALNTVMNADGLALRVAGNAARTWVGASNTEITNRVSWGLGGGQQAPTDVYVLFNAATAGSSRVVTVGSAANLRGLYFRSTAASGDAFAFSGAGTLTLGRGGLVNYDEARQSFGNALLLGDSQYWDAGPGGFAVGALDTNGKTLEIGGAGHTLLQGIVSGAGKLAVSGGRVDLLAANTHSGGTFLHAGELRLGSSGTLGAGTLTLAGGRLASDSAQARALANTVVVNGNRVLLGDAADNGALTLSGAVSFGGAVRTLELAADATFSGTLSSGGLRKEGSATLRLAGSGTLVSGLTVAEGAADIDGTYATTAVLVEDGAVLGGGGRIGALAGAGTVAPGNSPGILTATSVDPSGGLDFAFEFTQLGDPDWGSAAASGNDVLRLTGVTPFLASLGSANTLSIFLDLGTLSPGDVFRGGFFTDADADFLADVAEATTLFHLADTGGGIVHNGLAYRAYDGPLAFQVGTAQVSAAFAGGTESGTVLQFTVVPVPEPSAYGLALGALALAAAARRRLRP